MTRIFYDREGYHRNGFNREGFNRSGCDIEDYYQRGLQQGLVTTDKVTIRRVVTKGISMLIAIHKITKTKYDQYDSDTIRFRQRRLRHPRI